jgi:hypothetical protein
VALLTESAPQDVRDLDVIFDDEHAPDIRLRVEHSKNRLALVTRDIRIF